MQTYAKLTILKWHTYQKRLLSATVIEIVIVLQCDRYGGGAHTACANGWLDLFAIDIDENNFHNKWASTTVGEQLLKSSLVFCKFNIQ